MKRVLAIALVLAACKPDFGVRESLVDREEVLAVRVDPPEAAPGQSVRFSALVASTSGTLAPATAWAWCATPKLLTENGAVATACTADGVVPAGVSTGEITATLPADGCFVFGPETRSADLRPRDPDVTGGWFQPIRATVDGGTVAFGFARLACNLANASADVVTAYKARYARNRNPELSPLGVPAEVARGATITIRAAWRPEDAEVFVVLDPTSQTLVERRESLRVSWHATGGAFEHDRTGRTAQEPESFTENAWTAPDAAGLVHLWAVLRDARGGVAFTSTDVTVR